MGETVGSSLGSIMIIICLVMGLTLWVHAVQIAQGTGIDVYVADSVRLDGYMTPETIAEAQQLAAERGMEFEVIENPDPVPLGELATLQYELHVPYFAEIGKTIGLVDVIPKNKAIMRTGER
ncbi:hypothetical protein [Aneurinibacillus aneurinilyticus]|uniref:hypothetical protein n=3 Tax=Aneurinibacillus aneurinilyticus TaxID=1391 RepID=UPI0004022A4E|nr:hypothetical protein [Aneurinibacillus aneurinilyticus]MED0730389.1 hypothetical protein [Aneurinibacillus aneurinilyticus]MED0739218.1 hypothetical protein [Aneurinibacillus aneurinilyticus]